MRKWSARVETERDAMRRGQRLAKKKTRVAFRRGGGPKCRKDEKRHFTFLKNMRDKRGLGFKDFHAKS